MTSARVQRFGRSRQGQAPLSVSFILVYEDMASGLRAKQSMDAMSRRLADSADLRTRLCRFDLLRSAWFREQLALEAAAAHVIILSLHGNENLSLEVRDWLGGWLKYKEDRAYALGVLLDPSAAAQATRNPVVVYLRQIAALAGAELFCSFGEPFGTGAETVDAGGLRSVSRFAPVPCGDHFHLEPHSRWRMKK